MKTIFRDHTRISAKLLFLIDGLGAITTALLLSQLLARFEPLFGMPRPVLFVLAGIAACFAVYSLLCYFLLTADFRPFLKGIAIANTSYCVATMGLMLFHFSALTWLGIAYFVGEIAVVLALAYVEYQKATDGARSNPH